MNKLVKRVFCVGLCALISLSLFGCSDKDLEPKQDEKFKAHDINRVDDYLFTITYGDDYVADYQTNTEKLAKTLIGVAVNRIFGGCASVRNGDMRGRNYDWLYDQVAYFVINTPAKDGRHASLGVTGTCPTITEEDIFNGQWLPDMDLLPYFTLDGVNDAGVSTCILVVPTGEAGYTTGTNPGGERICTFCLNRYVLDNAGSVDEAVALLKKADIFSMGEGDMSQEFHWMISDPQKTVVIEIVDNELRVVEDENIVTNFYLYNFDKTQKTLPRIPEGIERYNILKAGYDTASTKEGMMKLMQSCNYSQTYDVNTVPFWYSEFSNGDLDGTMFGEEDLSDGNLSKAGKYEEVVNYGVEAAKRGRNGNTWITVYTSVYDMKNLTLDICCQEKTDVHSFSMKK